MTKRTAALAICAALGLIVVAAGAAAGGSSRAHGTFVDAAGNTVGWVQLVEDARGTVHVNVHVDGLTPGKHGIHIHSVAACSPTFAAAGGHYNPLGHQHGLLNPSGAHAGDLPNLIVNPDGVGRLTGVTDGVTITAGPTTLFDDTPGRGRQRVHHPRQRGRSADRRDERQQRRPDRLRGDRGRMTVSSLGRHGDTAMWVVLALVPGPRTAVGLLDAVRRLDGRIGPGRLLGAVARLERLAVIEHAPTGRRGLSEYRLGRRLLSDASATPTITTTTEEPTA